MVTPTCSGFELGAADIHVWQIDASRAPGVPVLSTEESERANRRLGESRVEFVTTHDGLRHILGFYLGCSPDAVPLICEAGQKPQLADDEFEIGLSHRAGLALVALSHSPVGVDIERPDSIPADEMPDFADFVLGDTERALLAAAHPDERPRRLALSFARKEAAMKARGLGLGDISLRDVHSLSDRESTEPLKIYDLDLGEDYLGALATTEISVSISFYDLSEIR